MSYNVELPAGVSTENEHRATTKPPPWRFLVAADLFCAELSSGLFISATLAWLIDWKSYGTVAQIAYPIAFVFLIADLVWLVLDLGQPLRFHHMLRVFKIRSPMSTGTWALSIFSPLLLICVLLMIFGGSPLRSLTGAIAALALAPAFFIAGYKGVMFSCTAQPIWKDARWLAADLVCSAALMGLAGALLIAIIFPLPLAVPGLRKAQLTMLCVSLVFALLVEYRISSYFIRHRDFGNLGSLVALIVLGWIVPIVLTAVGRSPEAAVAAILILFSAAVHRLMLIRYPHHHSNSATRDCQQQHYAQSA
jgi:polysulfide reductase-like protein